MTRAQGRGLAAVLVLALVLRVAWAAYATGTPQQPLDGDQFFYFHYGKEIARGNGYVNFLTGHPTAYYPVGYPGILSGLFWVVWHTPLPDELPMAASLLQASLGTATVGLVFLIGRRTFGIRVALVASAITAAYPNLVYYTSTMALETAFIAASLAAVAVLVAHDWTKGAPTNARLVAFGAVLGLSSVVRPFSLAFLLGLAVAVLVVAGSRRAVIAMGWALLPIVVILAPWTIRNMVRLDSPVVFSTNMGDTLCIDRWEGGTRGFRSAEEGCAPPPAQRPEDYPADFEVRQNSENTRLALTFIREHPGQELLQVARRARSMFENGHDGLLALDSGDPRGSPGKWTRTALERAGDAALFTVLVLGFLGLSAFFRRSRDHPDRVFIGIAMTTLVAIPLALWGNPRFHLPLVPFLAISAAVPVTVVWSSMEARYRRASATPPS